MIKAATSDITKGWPYDAENGYSPALVQVAVHDPEWQKIRRQMKGVTTAKKLEILLQWRRRRSPGIFGEELGPDIKARVQIDNYLGALRRGGQLDMSNMIQKVK